MLGAQRRVAFFRVLHRLVDTVRQNTFRCRERNHIALPDRNQTIKRAVMMVTCMPINRTGARRGIARLHRLRLPDSSVPGRRIHLSPRSVGINGCRLLVNSRLQNSLTLCGRNDQPGRSCRRHLLQHCLGRVCLRWLRRLSRLWRARYRGRRRDRRSVCRHNRRLPRLPARTVMLCGEAGSHQHKCKSGSHHPGNKPSGDVHRTADEVPTARGQTPLGRSQVPAGAY